MSRSSRGAWEPPLRNPGPPTAAAPAPAAVMWWDGGDRAITAREKARIEEHGPSCFSIALVPATPAARWAADGQPDPHGNSYACERAALTLGNLTDDELANAVFLHGNEQPTMAGLAAGKALAGIVYLTAAKERIRWLSRALVDATCKQPLQVGEVQGDALLPCPFCAEPLHINGAGDGVHKRDSDCILAQHVVVVDHPPHVSAWNRRAEFARQPGAREEVTDAEVDKAWDRFEAAMQAPDGDTPEDRVLSQTIDQRDRYQEVADELADHLARITGVEIGEHSSVNCPWQNAIEAAESYTPAQVIDLGPFRKLAEEWSGIFDSERRHGEYSEYRVTAFKSCARQLLALIDSQHDAAPGVGNG